MENVHVEAGTSPPHVLGRSQRPMVSCDDIEVSTLTLCGSSAKSAENGVRRLLASLPIR